MIAQLLDDIAASRRAFLEAIGRFDAQAVTVPVAEGRWSPIEYLEHLVRAEEATIWRMFGAVEDARAGRERLASPTPDAPIEEVVDRTWRVREDAPPLAVPQLRGSAAYWTTRMERNAALVDAFATLVDPSELDTLAYPHPISGPFTMRQGLQFIRFHLDRHRGHLEEAVD